MKAAVLLSAGIHPASGRRRVSHADLSALQLAQGCGSHVVGIHAGARDELMHDYGAYGLAELVFVPDDGVHGIAGFVIESGIDLLVAGEIGESHGSQGLFPYAIARALSWRVIPEAIRLDIGNGAWKPTSRIDGSTHRLYPDTARSVLIARRRDIGSMVYAAHRRSRLKVRALQESTHPRRDTGPVANDTRGLHRMPQPAWTLPDVASDASQRLRMLRGDRGRSSTQLLVDPPPEEAIREMAALFHRHGLNFPTAYRSKG